MNRELKIKTLRESLEKLNIKIKSTNDKTVYLGLVSKFLELEKDIEIQQSYLVTEKSEG